MKRMTTPIERLISLPGSDEVAGTVYEDAHRLLVQAVTEHDAELVAPESGQATGVVVIEHLDPQRIDEVLSANPQVSWVQLPSAGIETYLPVIRRHRQITFTSAKGSYAGPVAEHALALTLALLRRLPERIRATRWGGKAGFSLNDAHAVVVGGGGIGTEIVRLLGTWTTHITVVRRRDEPVEGAHRTVTTQQLDEVLADADVVVLAAAATDETRAMIGATQFERMKETAVLVNIARGSLVDTDALVTALQQGQIRAVGTDVTDPEPLPEGHPLWAEPNALITPHSADTPQMCIPLLQDRITANLVRRAEARLAGSRVDAAELVGVVDPDAGY